MKRIPVALLLLIPSLRAQAQDMFAPRRGEARGAVLSMEAGSPVPFAVLLLAVHESTLTYPDTAYLGYSGQFSPNQFSGPVWVAAAACPGAQRSAIVHLFPPAPGDTTRPIIFRVPTRSCPPPSDEREYRGHYTGGFEASDFVACGGEGIRDNNWWVDILPDAGKTARWGDGDDVGNARRYYVRWRGVLSPPGRYGHMSAGRHLLVVTRVLEMRRPTPDDCGAPP